MAAQPYLKCSYRKGLFPDESVIKFVTAKGNFEWCFVNNIHMIRSDEKLSSEEREGQVKISLYDQDKSKARIGIMDAGAKTVSTFRVPLEDIVHS